MYHAILRCKWNILMGISLVVYTSSYCDILFSLLTLSWLENTFNCCLTQLSSALRVRDTPGQRLSADVNIQTYWGHTLAQFLSYVYEFGGNLLYHIGGHSNIGVLPYTTLEATRVSLWISVMHPFKISSFTPLKVTCVTYEVICVPVGSSLSTPLKDTWVHTWSNSNNLLQLMYSTFDVLNYAGDYRVPHCMSLFCIICLVAQGTIAYARVYFQRNWRQL